MSKILALKRPPKQEDGHKFQASTQNCTTLCLQKPKKQNKTFAVTAQCIKERKAVSSSQECGSPETGRNYRAGFCFMTTEVPGTSSLYSLSCSSYNGLPSCEDKGQAARHTFNPSTEEEAEVGSSVQG